MSTGTGKERFTLLKDTMLELLEDFGNYDRIRVELEELLTAKVVMDTKLSSSTSGGKKEIAVISCFLILPYVNTSPLYIITISGKFIRIVSVVDNSCTDVTDTIHTIDVKFRLSSYRFKYNITSPNDDETTSWSDNERLAYLLGVFDRQTQHREANSKARIIKVYKTFDASVLKTIIGKIK